MQISTPDISKNFKDVLQQTTHTYVYSLCISWYKSRVIFKAISSFTERELFNIFKIIFNRGGYQNP